MSPQEISTALQAVPDPLNSASAFLRYGFMGFGFLLMYLAYGILRDLTKVERPPSPMIVGVACGFMTVAVLMAAMATALELAKLHAGNAEFTARLAAEKKTATLYVWLDPRDLPKVVTSVPELDTTAQDTCSVWPQKCRLAVNDGEAVTFHIGKLIEQLRQCDDLARSRLSEAAVGKKTEGIGRVPF